MNRVWIIIFSFLFISQYALGDEIEFQVYSKNKVEVNEVFRLEFSINAQANNFTPPNFENVEIESGPSSSSQSNVSIINGKLTQNVSIKYTYTLRASQLGQIKIGAASVKVNNKTFKTSPISIQVVKGNQKSAQNKPEDINISKDLFIRATVNSRRPYLGEQVIVSYKVYSRLPISQIQVAANPDFKGFWTQNMTNERYLERNEETINGRKFASGLLLEKAIFPQKSGNITIPPMDVNVIAQIKTKRKAQKNTGSPFDAFFNDPFFHSDYENIKKTLSSNPITLEVKNLPTENKPLSFNGAVGSYQLDSEIDSTKLETNSAINIKLKLSGKGNIDLVDNIDFKFPPDFDVFEPKITNDIKTDEKGVYGSKLFEYLIVPRSPGQFKIAPVEFTYFDPKKKQYFTIETPEYELNIKKGKNTDTGDYYAGIKNSEIQYLGKDIRHIKLLPFNLESKNQFLLGSLAFWLSLIIPLFLLIIITKLTYNVRLTKGDAVLMRHKQATKISKQRLAIAKSHMVSNNKNDFYNSIASGLWGYVTDKFNIQGSELSIDKIEQSLQNHQVSETSIKQFILILKECEFARFAPGDPNSKMDEIYKEAIKTITNIESELK